MDALKNPDQIKTILFDVGHTLLFPDADFLFSLAREHTRLDEKEFKRLGAQTKETAYRKEPRYPFKSWFSEWMLQSGVSASVLPSVLGAIQNRHEKKHLWSSPEQDIPQILIDLREANYILGVISNSDGSVGPLLEEFRLDAYFKCILDSAVVGIEKPDARIFYLALNELQSQAEESLYVGDHVIFDITAAQNIGMQAVLIDPYNVVDDSPAPKIQRLSELKQLLNL